jgi:rubrerythrin
MSITFNADEIFEMAETIERNAVAFYREAAGKASDQETKQMLLDLAAMEEGHEKTFAQMRRSLSEGEKEPTVYDPDGEAIQYLRTMAEFHGTEGKVSRTQKLTGRESMEEILRIALQTEKDGIAFYVGIKNLVPAKAGRDKVEKIIVEEMTHVSALGARLHALK